MKSLPEWRYLPYGKVAHALIPNTTRAYCGAEPRPRDTWRVAFLLEKHSCEGCLAMLGEKP